MALLYMVFFPAQGGIFALWLLTAFFLDTSVGYSL